MSQDIINNRFLEESVFAIADGYCVINLSKNIEWPPFLSPWLPTSSFLQIPPHDGHPCFRLYPSHYRADFGLSPIRNVRHRAHYKKEQTGDALPALFIYKYYFNFDSLWMISSLPGPFDTSVIGT